MDQRTPTQDKTRQDMVFNSIQIRQYLFISLFNKFWKKNNGKMQEQKIKDKNHLNNRYKWKKEKEENGVKWETLKIQLFQELNLFKEESRVGARPVKGVGIGNIYINLFAKG